MNNLIETICEDNKVRYTRVGDLHYSLQRKDGYRFTGRNNQN